ncbi:50S ribosomal protein L11 [Candidatus Vidania fulgoroideorum]
MKYKIKLMIEAKTAKPSASINSSLGPKGININDFCKKFNELTKNYNKGDIVPVLLIINKKKFKIKLKNPTVSFYLKKFLKINTNILSERKNISVKHDVIYKIYKKKKLDFNTREKKKIFKTIIGTIKSLGLSYEKKNL